MVDIFGETLMLPTGFALPAMEEGLPLLAEAAPSTQDPYATQRAGTEADLKNAFEAGSAAYKAEESKLSTLHLPWWLDMPRLGTGVLGLLLIAAGVGVFGAKVVMENKGKIAKAAGIAG